MARVHAVRKRPNPNPFPEGEGTNRRLAWVTNTALFMSVALVLARGMMQEMLRDPFQVEMNSQPVPRGPGAATGVVLDLLCCVPALLVLLRAAIDRSFVLRRSLAHVFVLLLGAWAVISTVWASDKFAAVLSASHWLSAAVLLWSTSQLARDWSGLRLAAAAAFGLLLVLSAHGIIYRLVELPELKQDVERNWPQLLRERGWEPDSYIAQRFRMRVMAGEMIGFNASPNTFGATVVLLGVVTAGLALQRLANRDEFGWPLVLGAGLVPAAWVLMYTNSRSALATPVLAAGMLAAAWLARGFIIKHRRLVFASSVALFLLVAAAAVGHGMYRGTLFHDSLTFRWKYWVGAWRVFEQFPVLGVGYANFGAHYLGVRLPEAAEEINDPHNFIVRFFVELGVVGGALLLAWMVRLWWELTRPVLPALRDDEPTATRFTRGNEVLPRLLWLAAVATVLTVIAAVDFSMQWQYGFIEVLKRSLYMLLLMIGLVVGTLRSTRVQAADDRPAPLLLYAVLVALAVFLVHNLVDFSLFETGPMFVFALLAGAALGARLGDARSMSRPLVLVALGIGLTLWLGGALGLAAPVIIAEGEARRADEEVRTSNPAPAAERLRRAFETMWVPNGDYAYRAARAMVMARRPAEQVRAMITAAIDASPMNAAYVRLLADFERHQPAPDERRVLEAFDRVIALDPRDVSARLDYAGALERFGRNADAKQRYEEALRLNDLMDPAEPERLPKQRVEEIRAKLTAL